MAEILIVDDTADIRTLLELMVRMAGHQVREASDGRKGLEAIAERPPDLVLLDVEMPILNGPKWLTNYFCATWAWRRFRSSFCQAS